MAYSMKITDKRKTSKVTVNCTVEIYQNGVLLETLKDTVFFSLKDTIAEVKAEMKQQAKNKVLQIIQENKSKIDEAVTSVLGQEIDLGA